ncbi:hypothetical protein L198_06807 [Cryptococcus wingfieldii CBS 7118]|uniref:Uncharacterized protein n=1 Tax=Cryptococcus wingfieldii CBS 7118 TaxID=1295528 RepID=A0A1E3IHI8_9TREE|nr:hypothetical protein L198_06807 [Cryptococcus wingfieldii CBS 7118]ODN88059.1 hypothetical protein L198_06807 [Cryptococcus wingfieldii CBS 7118]
MDYHGSTLAGLDAPPEKLADTVPGIFKVIDEATKDKTSGLLWNQHGTKVPFRLRLLLPATVMTTHDRQSMNAK